MVDLAFRSNPAMCSDLYRSRLPGAGTNRSRYCEQVRVWICLGQDVAGKDARQVKRVVVLGELELVNSLRDCSCTRTLEQVAHFALVFDRDSHHSHLGCCRSDPAHQAPHLQLPDVKHTASALPVLTHQVILQSPGASWSNSQD